MIKVFASENRLQVQQIKDLLESHHIPCFIKNEYAIGAVGELSPFDAWPEVWLTDPEWEPKANSLIQEFSLPPITNEDWFCRQCGERNAATFEICWNCGKAMEV